MSIRTTGVAAAVALVASQLAVGQTTATGQYPVTPAQHRVANEVAQAGVPLSALSPNAPERYTVKSGDTLWGISSMYLVSPWRWPELWGMNRQQVHNPHLIYPGQTLVLLRGNGRAQLQIGSSGFAGGPGDTVKLSPQVRDASTGDLAAISSIPNNLIEPFLSQPMVISATELDKYPRIVATPESHVFLGRGDTAYARGITDEAVETYHVFRPVQALYDPDDRDHKKPIGWESHFLGSAKIAKRGEVTTVRIIDSREEIGVGDRLLPITKEPLVRYVPHRPDRAVDGRIVSIYNGEESVGSNGIVTLNRGANDGLEIGSVVALLQTGQTVRDTTVAHKEMIKLPDERIGEMFVFRVFDSISYALILRTTDAVKLGDRFTSPDDPAAAPLNASAPVAAPTAATDDAAH